MGPYSLHEDRLRQCQNCNFLIMSSLKSILLPPRPFLIQQVCGSGLLVCGRMQDRADLQGDEFNPGYSG